MTEPGRIEVVDDLLCDAIVAFNRKSVKGDWHKQRRVIERYARAIIEYCDETRPSPDVTGTLGIARVSVGGEAT